MEPNKKFTASEVRSAIGALDALDARDMEYEAGMLRAFADLLEAQERAVPAAWLRDSGVDIESEAACVTNTVRNLWLASNPKRIERYTIPLYTHPAPSDAERLEEALRNLVSEWVAIADDGDATLEDSTIGYRACANRLSAMLAAHHAQAQPPAASVTDAPVPVFSWQPIETAPKNNKRPLFLARFNDDGSLQSFDYDASWMSESESWEIPEVYFFWASANGNVEEPTHWAYQPAGFGKIEAALAEQENPNG